MAEYIKREDAIKALVELTAYTDATTINTVVESAYHYSNEWIGGIRDALIEIGDIPAADARPVVRGEWVLDSDGLPVCSHCGEIALQRVFTKVPQLIMNTRMIQSNFCPNCGADMRGEHE